MTDHDPGAPVLAGSDPHDPDADVLDSLVEQSAEPPVPGELPKVWDETTPAPLRAPTRLLTGTLTIQPSWMPTLLLPADLNRLHLKIEVAASDPAVNVRVSDDAGKLQARDSSFLANSGRAATFDDFTGPVWVYAPDAAAGATITYAAVTK